jgi:hypothetical protein
MSIKIKHGTRGYYITIDGMYVHHSLSDGIKVIYNKKSVPYGATQWVSIIAIRTFWRKYMPIVIKESKSPHVSVWGELKPMIKSEAVSKVLQLMDKDYSFEKALEEVIKSDKTICKKKLVEDLNAYI